MKNVIHSGNIPSIVHTMREIFAIFSCLQKKLISLLVHFLLMLGLDPVKTFGRLHGTKEAPRMQQQVDLDTRICIGFLLFTGLLLIYECHVRKENEVENFKFCYANAQKINLDDLL